MLLGRPGSGKSTLLHLLAGLLPPTQGTVTVEGSVGLVLQQPERQLFCATVFDEVAFGLRHQAPPRRWWPRRRKPGRDGDVRREGTAFAPPFGERRRDGGRERDLRQRVDAALRSVGLEPAQFGARHPRHLSGGERRRLAIACALVLEPAVLLLDEPLAGLDGPGRRAIVAVLHTLRASGHALLVASHSLEPLVAVADRVLALRDGRLVVDGPPDGVLRDPAVLRAAGLEPLPLAVLASRLAAHGADSLDWRSPAAFSDTLVAATRRPARSPR